MSCDALGGFDRLSPNGELNTTALAIQPHTPVRAEPVEAAHTVQLHCSSEWSNSLD